MVTHLGRNNDADERPQDLPESRRPQIVKADSSGEALPERPKAPDKVPQKQLTILQEKAKWFDMQMEYNSLQVELQRRGQMIEAQVARVRALEQGR